MAKHLTPEDRRRLADIVGVHEATLYQAVTGKGRGFSPAECVRIERESNHELRRWDLRPNDWHLIWPELVGVRGSPSLPGTAVSRATAAPGRRTDRPQAGSRETKGRA